MPDDIFQRCFDTHWELIRTTEQACRGLLEQLGKRVDTAQGLTAAAFSGNKGGRLPGIAGPVRLVPSEETAGIQEMHILLGHIPCAEVEHRLGL